MIECTAGLHDPIAQSHKLDGQVIVTDQTARHPRPYPPAGIRVSRKVAVENIELETLSCCPGATGRLVGGDQHNRPAGLARIAPPEDAEPIACSSHLRSLDPSKVSGQMCCREPISLKRTVAEAGRMAAHPRRLARLTKAVGRGAARHLPVRPVTKTITGEHEFMSLRVGLKSEYAPGSRVSPP
jgi:hypothetical protein